MSNHTQGDWFKANDSVNPITHRPGWSVGVIGKTICAVESDNSEADAQLISSAPDLLGALEEMFESFITGEHYETQNPYTRGYVKKAISAIAKARGPRDK